MFTNSNDVEHDKKVVNKSLRKSILLKVNPLARHQPMRFVWNFRSISSRWKVDLFGFSRESSDIWPGDRQMSWMSDERRCWFYSLVRLEGGEASWQCSKALVTTGPETSTIKFSVIKLRSSWRRIVKCFKLLPLDTIAVFYWSSYLAVILPNSLKTATENWLFWVKLSWYDCV